MLVFVDSVFVMETSLEPTVSVLPVRLTVDPTATVTVVLANATPSTSHPLVLGVILPRPTTRVKGIIALTTRAALLVPTITAWDVSGVRISLSASMEQTLLSSVEALVCQSPTVTVVLLVLSMRVKRLVYSLVFSVLLF